jgi:rhodanese-related sulfurtransferase
MNPETRRWIAPVVLILATAACGKSSETPPAGAEPAVSGRLEAGLRVLTINPEAQDQHFRIYRGDYVRPELSSGASFTLEIPALEVNQVFPATEGAHPYFKVPETGSYAFKAGAASGVIEAVSYQAAQYSEVTAAEAAAFIANRQPLILDVRTEREFAGGHLEGAVLIPVQALQGRLAELASRKQEPVLVYCASGNRSTVAAKLLIDAGFQQVTNLRRGIAEWSKAGLPVVK